MALAPFEVDGSQLPKLPLGQPQDTAKLLLFSPFFFFWGGGS